MPGRGAKLGRGEGVLLVSPSEEVSVKGRALYSSCGASGSFFLPAIPKPSRPFFLVSGGGAGCALSAATTFTYDSRKLLDLVRA